MLVAPLVGAWIEILSDANKASSQKVAPLVGAWIEICVVEQWVAASQRRSPRGSVDWNSVSKKKVVEYSVAPLVGAWIEIDVLNGLRDNGVGRSPRGSVDWNTNKEKAAVIELAVAPLVGAWIEIVHAFCHCAITLVAPLVGARIEIYLIVWKTDRGRAAPFEKVWLVWIQYSVRWLQYINGW